MTFKTKLLALLLQMHQIISTLSELEHSNIPFHNAEVEGKLTWRLLQGGMCIALQQGSFLFLLP